MIQRSCLNCGRTRKGREPSRLAVILTVTNFWRLRLLLLAAP